LTADCDTDVSLAVFHQTLDGAGHTLTAHDPPGGNFMGAVLSNNRMWLDVENLTVEGTGFATNCSTSLTGISFTGAGGNLNGVNIENITQHNDCQLGWAVTANNAAVVNVTNMVATGYQKAAILAQGPMGLNVSASTLGPPDSLQGVIAQNGIQYGGTGVDAGTYGTISQSTIYGSGSGHASDPGTAVLLYGAPNVTISNNTITGAGTDLGVAVATDTVDTPNIASTGVTISHNHIARTAPDSPDSFGIGVSVNPPTVNAQPVQLHASADASSATLICNTFSGWKTNIGDATQAPCVIPGSSGYWLATARGQVSNFGAAHFHGSAAGMALRAPVVGIAHTPAGGYWLASTDGGVFGFAAPFLGSLGGTRLNAPVVGIAATPDGRGYYLVSADGGVFTYGDAHFKGSTGNVRLNEPIVGLAVTADNRGYYLVAADGGVFTFGDARYRGSLGGTPLAKPVVGMAVDTATSGYWLVAADGGLFTFHAPFVGSTANVHLVAPIVAVAATHDNRGYRFVASDGGVFCFGTAHFQGSLTAAPPDTVVDIASTG
jgi:hypothetical protein